MSLTVIDNDANRQKVCYFLLLVFIEYISILHQRLFGN